MKQFFKYLGLAAIVLFSFYYTEKIALLVQSKSPIMKTIVEYKEKNNILSVNAEIIGETIIPGLDGQTINEEKSFVKMKEFGTFNDYYLVYDKVKPKISVDNNLDKTIIKGNKNKKSVSLIVSNNEQAIAYLKSKGTVFSALVIEETYSNNSYELINAETNSSKFSNVESLLNKDKKNTKICLITDQNHQLCRKNKHYLVKATHTLTASNLLSIKTTVESGAIILLEENATISDINILIKQIEFQGLKIISLSNLISESN